MLNCRDTLCSNQRRVIRAKSIDIRRLSEAISVEKDNGTKVNYFLYPEFEINQNVLPANTIQDWHKH